MDEYRSYEQHFNSCLNNILTAVNRRLKKESRSILLLLDNVSSHDSKLQCKFSNIKVVFLPKILHQDFNLLLSLKLIVPISQHLELQKALMFLLRFSGLSKLGRRLQLQL